MSEASGRRLKFSERLGYRQPRTLAQVESMDADLRTALWNVTYQQYLISWDAFNYRYGETLMRVLWVSHFNRDLSKVPEGPARAADALKPVFEADQWFEVYDLVQAIVDADGSSGIAEYYDAMMQTHLAGYRIINGDIVALTDPEEVKEVESALANTGPFPAARHHLRTALALYSQREEPDYANSIKESISAVESIAREITGKSKLSAALDEVRRQHPQMHQGLLAGWKALYGFTSDEPAIRHGGATPPQVNQDLARYFLVTCSSFVNFLLSLDGVR